MFSLGLLLMVVIWENWKLFREHVEIYLYLTKLGLLMHCSFSCFCICNFRSALDGECGFLAANLYAKSVFGEDALVNISIEKQGDGKLSGYIRIRSKTQGIALSLGDKITLKQKGGGS